MPRKRRTTEAELRAFGRRLREHRIAAGLTQAELAQRRFSHAYVSVLEAGKREPSQQALTYFANKLRVPVEALWADKGVDWTVELASALRSEGKVADGRALLIETLTNLDRDRQVNRRALVVLHREIGKVDQEQGRRNEAARHFAQALELIGEEDELLNDDRAELHVRLGDLRMAQGDQAEAFRHHRTASYLLLELMGRPL